MARMARITHPVHPDITAACAKDCPPGFKLDRQLDYVKGIDTVRKKAEKQHGGKANVVVMPGHYKVHDNRRMGGRGSGVIKMETGCRIYVRDIPKKVRRNLPGTNTPAGEPDDSRLCECGASPVEPTTGKCGPCLWGEFKTQGGNW